MSMPGALLASSNPVEHLVERSVYVGSRELDFLTNHRLMLLAAAALLVVMLLGSRQRRAGIPSGLYNLIEAVCVFIRDQVVRPALGEDTDRFIKYLWTIFFFILFCNLLGLIPTEGIIHLVSGGWLRNMGGTATGNIWVTGSLAVTAFVMVHVSGVRQQGVRGYLRNFIPRVPVFLMPIMYVLEVIGSVVKPFSLAVRLFANMLAGHAVLGALLGLIFLSRSYAVGGVTVVVCALFSVLELFVAFLQAYIFTFLATLFIAAAVRPEH